MPKIPKCDRCRYYSNDFHLVCALHPIGVESDNCSDFSPNLELEGKRFVDFLGLQQQTSEDLEQYSNPYDFELGEDLWQPEGARYIDGELVIERDRSFYMVKKLSNRDSTGLKRKC